MIRLLLLKHIFVLFRILALSDEQMRERWVHDL